MMNRLPWGDCSAKAMPSFPLRRNGRSAPKLTEAITRSPAPFPAPHPHVEIVSILVLLEKDRLRSRVFGVLKVAQTNANKPVPLLRTEINPCYAQPDRFALCSPTTSGVIDQAQAH